MCGVEHGLRELGGLGFFFITVKTVGGVAERDGEGFGNGGGLRFIEGMDVRIDRFLILRPFRGFGSGFVQRGAVGFFEADDGDCLQTVVRRDFGVGEILTFFKRRQKGKGGRVV